MGVQGWYLRQEVLQTYRFSEDLDFSILPEGVYTEDELRDRGKVTLELERFTFCAAERICDGHTTKSTTKRTEVPDFAVGSNRRSPVHHLTLATSRPPC